MNPYAMASLRIHARHQAGMQGLGHQPAPGFVQKLNPLPDGVEFLVTAQYGPGRHPLLHPGHHELVERLPALSRAMALTGGIWVCWPSGEGIKTSLSEDFVRQAALDIGLVDNKICVIDEHLDRACAWCAGPGAGWTSRSTASAPPPPRPERSARGLTQLRHFASRLAFTSIRT